MRLLYLGFKTLYSKQIGRYYDPLCIYYRLVFSFIIISLPESVILKYLIYFATCYRKI